MGVGILRNGAEGLDYGLLMAHHEHKLKQGEKSESSHRIHSSNMIHEQHLSSAAHLSAMNSVLKNSNTGKANGAHGKIVAAADMGVGGMGVYTSPPKDLHTSGQNWLGGMAIFSTKFFRNFSEKQATFFFRSQGLTMNHLS
jgi:hypothetical protein